MARDATKADFARLFAALAGASSALLHYAGALKSIPLLALAPVDITLVLALSALPALALAITTRGWCLAPCIGWPLMALAGLWAWLWFAAFWSPADALLHNKLTDILLVGPAMLLAGMAVAGDGTMLRHFCAWTMLLSAVVALALLANLAAGRVVLGGTASPQADQIRVAYQVTGLAFATAAGLAAVALVEARALGGRVIAALGLIGFMAATLLPGGRAALLAMVLNVALAPMVVFRWHGARLLPLLWPMAWLLMMGFAFAVMVLDAVAMPQLASLERLLMRDALEGSGRLPLWRAALDWAGAAMPFGLGLGGFTIAAGFGERRGLYPHNLGLEALAEAGMPGFLLWCLAFGGAAWAAWRLRGQVPAWRAARVLALCLPMAVTVMVSTDLGNRMAWFALGLALGLGLSSHPMTIRAQHVRALG